MSVVIEAMPDITFMLDHNPDDPIVHLYPRDYRYRVSGSEYPQPGDIALCGHVKVLPSTEALPSWPRCKRCLCS